MLRRPLEHPIMSFETIEIKMAAVSVKRSIVTPDKGPKSFRKRAFGKERVELNRNREWYREKSAWDGERKLDNEMNARHNH